MKLIIDISYGDYEWLKHHAMTILEERVANGTPLDNLTADLETLREPTEPHLVDYRYHRNDMLDAVLGVIERYKGGE